MSPAKYRTLREACGLSQQDAAAFHKVALRTIGHWENGRNGVLPDSVPAGAAQEMLDLNAAIERGVQNLLTLPVEEIALTRYRTLDDYTGSRAEREPLPWPAYNAMLGRILVARRRLGRNTTVSYAHGQTTGSNRSVV